MRSRSTPNSGGYNELSIEDRAGQEKIFLRAQRDIEQLILNDSHTSIGNDRHERISRDSRSLVENDRFEQVNMNSSSLIKGDELHTTQGERHTRIGGNELLSISGAGSIAVDGTWVVQAGSQARVTATNVLVDAGVNLTLKAGGQHIVINSAGDFQQRADRAGAEPRWPASHRSRHSRLWPKQHRPSSPIRCLSWLPPATRRGLLPALRNLSRWTVPCWRCRMTTAEQWLQKQGELGRYLYLVLDSDGQLDERDALLGRARTPSVRQSV